MTRQTDRLRITRAAVRLAALAAVALTFVFAGAARAETWTNLFVEDFDVPPGIIFREVDSRSGLLAESGGKDTLSVPFLEGTEPKKYFDPAEEHRLNEDIMPIYADGVSL